MLRISSEELSEWQAYYTIEPFGELRADLRIGMATAPLLNVHVRKGRRKAKPEDWIMTFGEEREPQTPEEMGMLLKGLAAAWRKKPLPQPRVSKKARRGRGKHK